LKLSKIGKIKIILHRKIRGKIKEVHNKHEKAGKWFAILVCEQMFASRCSLKRERIVGIDVGISNFAYDSDGGVAENPSFLRKSEKKLAKAQRILSRRTKGSANRQKQRRKVAKVHQKISNQRNAFLHRLSHYYVDKYDTIFVEDLRVENMKQNRKLSKSISDASWSTFFSMLEYKAARAGILFRKVIAAGTSQRCSFCGKVVIKSLAIRTHCCPYCGLMIDRDYNASLNIRQRGIDSLLPLEWREVTPVEIAPIPIAKSDRQARSLKQEAIGFNRW
jgi:putative transposase